MRKTEIKYIICEWDAWTIREFQRLGCTPHILYEPSQRDYVHKERDAYSGVTVSEVNFDSIESIANTAAHLRLLYEENVEIVSVLERTQYPAACLRVLTLDKPKSLLPALATRDKRIMKTILRNAGIAVAPFVGWAGSSPTKLREAIETEIGFPAVVKPASGRGTKRVYILENGTPGGVYEEIVQDATSHWIIEKYVEGQEVHVDTVWSKGQQIKAFVGVYQNPPREVASGSISNATVYIPRSHNPDLFDHLVALNGQAVTALGIATGVTHAEFFVRPCGEVIVGEVASRPAGGAHDDCIRYITGFGLKELAVRAVTDELPPDLAKPQAEYVGFVNLVPQANGRLKALPSRDALLQHQGVVEVSYGAEPGTVYEKFGACTWCVMPILAQPSLDDCFEAFNQLRAAVSIPVDVECSADARDVVKRQEIGHGFVNDQT